MELWIRSQDKESLLMIKKMFYYCTCSEMENLGEHYIGNREWVADKDYTLLGKYKTKERALEVLGEIQKFIEKGCKEYKSNGDYYTSNMNIVYSKCHKIRKEDNMKVGDYVRTIDGIIAKIIDVQENPYKEKTIYVLDKEIYIKDLEYGKYTR